MAEFEDSLRNESSPAADEPEGPRRSTFLPATSPASPSSLPPPPVRQSLPAETLAERLTTAADTGSTLELLEEFQEQLALREKEAAAFAEWERSVAALGTPAAVAAVEEARADFADLLDADPAGTASAASAPAPAEEEHVLHELIEPEQPERRPLGLGAVLAEEPDDGAAEPEPATPVEHIAGASLDHDIDGIDEDDEVDEIDRAFGELTGALPATAAAASLPDAVVSSGAAVPVEPRQSPRVETGEVVPALSRTSGPAALVVEENDLEPTPVDRRVGRAARLFWLWFAVNASVVSVAFGGVVLSLGMSLRQAIVATLAGVAISFFPLGLGTLAGKWSGQPTMVVSRASFGHAGNILPAVLALVTRLFWGAALLWFLAAGTARILTGAELGGGLTETQLTILGLAVGFVIALVIAFFGYGLLARLQLVLSIVSAILVVGLVVVTWPAVNIQNALTIGDGPWILVLSGAVLVFSFVGLVWAVSSADLARYQRPGSSGASSMLWSTFGATLPAFLLIVYGAMLAASDPEVATGLLETPLDTIALLIPIWYPVPLIAALALSLLSGVVVTIYSGGFALQAVGAPLRRSASVVIVGAALAVVAVVLAFLVGDFTAMLRDVATSLAVPIAAWAGIFGAEMMIRNRPFDAGSLLRRGGVYPLVRWVNLVTLLVASAVGFGLTTASVGWLAWQGYLFELLGIPAGGELAASDLGVLVALALGLIVPIVAGIPAIRRQEGAFRGSPHGVAATVEPVRTEPN